MPVTGCPVFSIGAHYQPGAAHQEKPSRRPRPPAGTPEVAARAHRPLLRHERHETRVELRDERLDELESHARMPTREPVEPQHLRRAHFRLRHRLADAATMRQHEVALQRRQVVRLDAGVRQLQITRLIAKVPTIAAFSYRHSQGLPYIYPNNDLSYTENFLTMVKSIGKPNWRPHPAQIGRAHV